MKKVLIFLSAFFLIVTTFQLVKTFAVFESSVNSEDNLSIAKWTIYVNDQNLNGNNSTFFIDNITYLGNDGVKADKFAPGVSGYFLLEIDPKDTDVSIDYELSFDMLEDFPHIKIVSVEGQNGKTLNLESNTYSRTITLDEITKGEKDIIKVNFIWEKDDLHNDVDSSLGLTEGSEFAFPVKIKFLQHIN